MQNAATGSPPSNNEQVHDIHWGWLLRSRWPPTCASACTYREPVRQGSRQDPVPVVQCSHPDLLVHVPHQHQQGG
jgi:hypothetical protein